jgi:hypothetical protein
VADAPDLLIKRNVFGMALVERRRRDRGGRRAGWSLQVWFGSAMPDVAA